MIAARTNWNCEFSRNGKNISYKLYEPFEKNINIYYQRLLTFVIIVIINMFN